MNRMRKIVSGATLVVVLAVPTVAPALALGHPTGQVRLTLPALANAAQPELVG